MARNDQPLAVRRAETVSEEAAVRHVDQLSESARTAFRDLRAGERTPAPNLDPGEVIVFTSYYRVVRAPAASRTDATADVDERASASEGCGGSTVRQ